MNRDDTVRVLAKAAAYDGRTVGVADIAAWWEACGDLDAGDAMQAVTLHYKDSSDWIMPAHLRYWAYQAKLERRRLERKHAPTDALALPSRFEPTGDAVRSAFERTTTARAWARAKAREASEKFHAAHDAQATAEAALDALDDAIAALADEGLEQV